MFMVSNTHILRSSAALHSAARSVWILVMEKAAERFLKGAETRALHTEPASDL